MTIKYLTQSEQAIITGIFDALEAAGFKCLFVDDGGDDDPDTMNPTRQQALELIDGVGQSTAVFTHPDTGAKRFGVFFVLGNSPGEVAANYTDLQPFARIIDGVTDEWQNTHCGAPGCDRPLNEHGQCDLLNAPDHWMMRT